MTLVRKRLHQLGRVVTGKTPPTARQELFQGEYLFVTPSDLDYNHYYCRSAERTVSEQAKATLRNQFIPANAVMFTCIGATIGKCGIAPSECLTNQQINSVIANDECDPRFLYYLLCNSVDIVKGMGGGAATPIVNKSKFENIDFLVPPLRQQQEVGRILSAYDDMIENNRRRIVLLEEAARLLYREWFVHFRFPGHEHVPLIDGLPEGWARVPAAEAFEVNPKTSRNDDGVIRYIPMSALSETGMVIDRGPVEDRDKSTSVRFRNGDTLLARITPCLENGKTGYVQFLSEDEVACGSTEFIVLRGRRVSNYFVYLTARQHDFRENAIRSMIGSSGRQRVQPSCFDRYLVPIPPQVLSTLFDEAVGGMFAQIGNLDQQNQKLAQARDLLLPRLMNGEIAV